MNFLKIKFFPSKIEDYLYFCVSNIIFISILLGIVEQRLDENYKNENMSEVMLFIPKIHHDFEEKRDLIFNQLSANSSIISVNKLENKEVKKLLFEFLKNINVSDDIIPEVYDVQVEHSKPLNLKIINNKIKKIIDGALVDKISNKKSKNLILSIVVLIIIILLNNLEQFPDSIFIEDPALIFKNNIIVLNPSDDTRNGEAKIIKIEKQRK